MSDAHWVNGGSPVRLRNRYWTRDLSVQRPVFETGSVSGIRGSDDREIVRVASPIGDVATVDCAVLDMGRDAVRFLPFVPNCPALFNGAPPEQAWLAHWIGPQRGLDADRVAAPWQVHRLARRAIFPIRVASVDVPKTRYADAGDIDIAYQVLGDGPTDVVYVPGWVSNIEVMWEDPSLARMLRQIASFSRLILFDKRGTGLSDQVSLRDLPTIETRMDDVRAVMDATGSGSATLLGHSEGGSMSIVFAATYPDRTNGLVLVGSYVSRTPSPDYPWAPDPADREAEVAGVEETWGDPDHIPAWVAPSRMSDRAYVEWTARYMRLSASSCAVQDCSA